LLEEVYGHIQLFRISIALRDDFSPCILLQSSCYKSFLYKYIEHLSEMRLVKFIKDSRSYGIAEIMIDSRSKVRLYWWKKIA
jgi:hypothetical protein